MDQDQASPPSDPRTGSDALAQALLRLSLDPVVFLVSGNQSLPLIDALGRRGIRLVHARHETGAGYMAEGWARSSGEPGIYLVSAGPGLTSALTPLANARLAEVPLICLSASHPLAQDGLGAFQELVHVQLTTPLCKATRRCTKPGELAAALAWAWQLATDFPPGPVHLELPVDVLSSTCPSDSPADSVAPPARTPYAAGEIAAALRAASQPLVLLRPALGRLPAAAKLRRHVPTLVVESPRGLRDPAWAAEQRDLVTAADCVAVLAPPDYAVDFARIGGGEVIVHADADAAVLDELATLLGDQPPVAAPPCQPPHAPPNDGSGPLHPLTVAGIVDELITDDDVLILDGGEFCQWIRHGLRHRPNRQLLNGKLGAIGGSIPTAIGASLHAPHRRHVAFIGDGAFGYYSAELDTAARHHLPLTVIVGMDGCWGSEWHQQQRRYDGRTYATEIGERRYDLIATGYGAFGYQTRNRYELNDTLAAALGDTRVSCISVHISREASPAL